MSPGAPSWREDSNVKLEHNLISDFYIVFFIWLLEKLLIHMVWISMGHFLKAHLHNSNLQQIILTNEQVFISSSGKKTTTDQYFGICSVLECLVISRS